MIKIFNQNNAKNADACFKAGLIESWGKGTKKIIDLMRLDSIQLSEIKEFAGGIQVDLIKADQAPPQAPPQATPQATPQVELIILEALVQGELSSKEDLEASMLMDRKHFTNIYFNPMIQKGLIELTIPDKPKRPNQKYKITDKG